MHRRAFLLTCGAGALLAPAVGRMSAFDGSGAHAAETTLERPISGVSTGFAALDRMTMGLQPSELVLVAGRPSMGKTTFAQCIAAQVALHLVELSLEILR